MIPLATDKGRGVVKVNDSKYKVLVETLKNQILGGKYDVAKPFPSVRALIQRFGMSKTTVQRALDELFHLGLISREQGRGTFVTARGSSRKIGLIVNRSPLRQKQQSHLSTSRQYRIPPRQKAFRQTRDRQRATKQEKSLAHANIYWRNYEQIMRTIYKERVLRHPVNTPRRQSIA